MSAKVAKDISNRFLEFNEGGFEEFDSAANFVFKHGALTLQGMDVRRKTTPESIL